MKFLSHVLQLDGNGNVKEEELREWCRIRLRCTREVQKPECYSSGLLEPNVLEVNPSTSTRSLALGFTPYSCDIHCVTHSIVYVIFIS